MDIYDQLIPVYVNQLHNCERWIDMLEAFAAEKKIEPWVLLQARLAPDQFPFIRQVTAACDTAKWAVAKLCGKEGPSHPDTEATVEELRARLGKVLTYIESFSRDDFQGAEDRRCVHRWMGGKWVRGEDYVRYFALPNFYFHTTSAYQILRHNGMQLAKTDYLRGLPMRD